MAPLRVLILADDPLARAGLAVLLSTSSVDSPTLDVESGLRVVGTAAPDDLDDASQRSRASSPQDVFRPEALLWDLGADPQAALASWARLTASSIGGPEGDGMMPRLPAVFLMPEPARIGPRQWASASRSSLGWGLLRRQSGPETIRHALRCALDGLGLIDPALLDPEQDDAGEGLPLRSPRSGGEGAPVEMLTSRELQVLKLIAEGLSNKQAAQALGIRENTVKYHVNAILGKLHAASRTEAVTRAARAGWLAL